MTEINEKKLEKMKYEILQKEDENSKTKEKTRRDMVTEIKDIITSNLQDKNY